MQPGSESQVSAQECEVDEVLDEYTTLPRNLRPQLTVYSCPSDAVQ